MSRSGRISKEEAKYIGEMCNKMSPDDIAAKLGRTPNFVRGHIREQYAGQNMDKKSQAEKTETITIRQELRNSVRWDRLKQELTKEEIRYFEEEYVKLYSQFQSNVLPSEEGQIFDAIKLDILKSRNLIERRRARDEISKLETQQGRFVRDNGEDEESYTDAQKKLVRHMESQLQTNREAEQSKTAEFVKLQERYDKLMESLKATRNQRVKDYETGKQTYLGLLKTLQQRDIQAYEGRQGGLMKLATDKEYRRLGSLHQYEDGSLDRPILSADTIDQEDETPATSDSEEQGTLS